MSRPLFEVFITDTSEASSIMLMGGLRKDGLGTQDATTRLSLA